MKCEANRSKRIRKGTATLCAQVAAIFLLLIYPTTVTAHSPGSVTLSYNLTTQILTVTVVHKTNSPSSHYINKVEIKKNGKSIESQNYTNQPDPSEFSYTYKISAKMGDILEVTASCSVYGSKTDKLIVKKQLS
jgi:hypothetical protein